MTAAIQGLLVFSLLKLNLFYAQVPFFIRGLWWKKSSNILILSLSVAFLALAIGLVTFGQRPLSYVIFNAALITIWYLEISISLSRGYFNDIFGKDLPKEIVLLISFIVGINGGYFTLMFIIKMFRPILNSL